MQERNLYKDLNLKEYIWGDVSLVDITGYDKSSKEIRIELLDLQCEKKQLIREAVE